MTQIDSRIEQMRKESWKIFDQIAGRYDLANRLLSLGLDIGWRRFLARCISKKEGMRLLDCATGSGDQLIACLKQLPKATFAVGLDPSREMLLLAEKRVEKEGLAATLVHGSMEQLPFEEKSFDCITVSFGIRNVSHVDLALAEMERILTPGGELAILEFSLPKSPLLRLPYLFYLRHVLVRIGGWLAGTREPYWYLATTIEQFPHGNAFEELLKKARFSSIRSHSLAFGAVTLYLAKKGG